MWWGVDGRARGARGPYGKQCPNTLLGPAQPMACSGEQRPRRYVEVPETVPDPTAGLDDRALTALGEEIMTLAEHVNVTTRRLLALIAEFDRREGWKLHGFSSCAEWLA